MQLTLTSEQILSLAADKYAIRTARTWSAREKWLRIGQHQEIVWGEFKSKSKTPIQTMISISKTLFTCTCTGRKLPCSHAIGLRLLYLESPHLFESSVPSVSFNSTSSDSVFSDETASEQTASSTEWLASFDDPQTALVATPKQTADASAAKANIARLQRIRKGLDELDLWLGDVVRNGLESVRDKKRAADWQRISRRLVDAQASELAITVRKMATIPGSTPHWPEELLAKMGTLHLLVEGFRNFEELPPEVQGDLRLAVGWLPKIEPDSTTIQADRWHVLARQPVNSGKQRRHKIWLWGEESNRPALITRILANKQKQIEGILPGTVLEGDLYFYPSMAPLRAELLSVERINAESSHTALKGSQNQPPNGANRAHESPLKLEQPSIPAPGYANFAEAFQKVHNISAQNPWLEEFPILVQSAKVEQVISARPKSRPTNNGATNILFQTSVAYPNGQTPKPAPWYITDETGIRLPMPDKFEYGWHLEALSLANAKGKDGIQIFGVWDRAKFTPFAVWKSERWLSLHILNGEL